MVGFLDLEANTDSQLKRDRTVFDIIEIGFLSEDRSLKFSTFIKPVTNNGLLFDRIKDLSGISQEQIDSGVSFNDATNTLHDLSNKVEFIYTWGTYDKFLLMRNKSYALKKGRVRNIINKITDLSDVIQKEFGLKNSISLINTAHILNIDVSTSHRALDDCELLRRIYSNRTRINTRRLEEFKRLDATRNKYQKIVFNDNHFVFADSDGVKKSAPE